MLASKWAVWSIISHAECSSIAKKSQAFRKTRTAHAIASAGRPAGRVSANSRACWGLWMIFMDPLEHTRLRKASQQRICARGDRRVASASPEGRLSIECWKPLKHGFRSRYSSREFANAMPGAHYFGIARRPAGNERHVRKIGRGPSRCFEAVQIATVEQARAVAQDALIRANQFFSERPWRHGDAIKGTT